MGEESMRHVLAALLLGGCASQVRLYDLEAGSVLSGTYERNASMRSGSLAVYHPEGPCTGEFQVTLGGTAGWGSIYSAGAGAPHYGTMQGFGLSLSNPGAAVVVCPSGRTIECEFIASGSSGNGYCRDNRGGRYRLMF
jgi:hypothetical protein